MSKGLTQEIQFQKACKTCQFSVAADGSEKKKLYDLAAEQIKDGLSYRKASIKLKEYAEKMGFKVKPPAHKSLWRHFESHVSATLNAQIQVAREDWAPKDDKPLVDYSMIEHINKGNFDEYDELCKLYTKFKEISNRIYEFDNALKIGSTNGGEQWSQNKISTFTSMVNTQKAILAEISKMRQGEKLVTIAAHYIIEQYTTNLVLKLKSEFDSFAAIMKRTGVNPDIIEAFNDMTGYRVSQLFTEEAGTAMNMTKKEFKLPN